MAKLPSAVDLQRRPAPSDTPGISVGQIDYSPMARGAASIGQGMHDIGKAINIAASSQNEIDDYDTRKKLLDFKLNTEMALEEDSRNMTPGGDGYTAAWQKNFAKAARDFVGKDDANIPVSQRAKVGMMLKQHEVALSERAQRYEMKERDRFHVDGLETQLGTLKDVVGANPDRRSEMSEEGRKQIELSRIPVGDKYRLAKKYEKELDKSHATARLMAPKTIENRDRFKSELRLDQEDVAGSDATGVLTSGQSKGKAAGWAATDPTWAKLSPFQKAAAMALMEADNQDPQAARNALGAMINRATKNGEDIGAHVSQKIYQPTIEPSQQQRLGRIINSTAFSDMTAWAERRASGQEPDPVDGATHFLASEKTMLALESREPQKYKSWRKWTNFDAASGQYSGVITRDGSHAFLAPEGRHVSGEVTAPPDPSRSYANLSIMERRELWTKYEGEWNKEISKADTEIKHLRERAQNGDLPPDAELQSIAARVKNLGDPRLAAHYDSTLSLANTMNRMFAVHPQLAEEFAKQQRTAVAEAQGGRYTEEQEKSLKAMEKAAETVRKATSEDPMSWTHRRQLEIPTGEIVQPGTADESGRMVPQPMRKVQLQPINFGAPTIDSDLAERINTARDVARFYNQPVQVFTKNERAHLETMVANGGAKMLHVLGKLVQVGGNDATAAIREFSKDAPEAYMIGKLMLEGGDKKLIEDASKEMQRRSVEKDKYINKVDRKLAEPDVSDLIPVLARTPGLQDPIKHMTDTIYNYRHRYLGKDKFDADLYKKTMREVLGETTDRDGNTYGGVGSQSTGWLFGSQKVLVPPQIKQNSFNEMIGALRTEDLAVLGAPTYKNGKEIPLRDIQKATWISLGDGKYDIRLDTDSDGSEVLARNRDGSVYVLDVKPILGALKKRKPEIFGSGGAAVQRFTDGASEAHLQGVIDGVNALDRGYKPGDAESAMVQDRRVEGDAMAYDGFRAGYKAKSVKESDVPEALKRLRPQMQE